jgi:hydroxymethylpyrimidine/phosphomethylpyrimidine kinase
LHLSEQDKMIANVLSIAGSDPSGGAGIQADLKTFSALGCYGMAVITALTAQNTKGVSGVHVPPAEFIGQQIDAIFADVRVDAVKIGMLGSGAVVGAVAERLKRYRPRFIVLDPVLVATSGDSLGSDDVVEAIRALLLPIATLITPNLPEAARLADASQPRDVAEMIKLAGQLENYGPAVLIKGGHLEGAASPDVLFDGTAFSVLDAVRIDTKNTHGTGCTLSSAIAVYLAQGHGLVEACLKAKDYLNRSLLMSDALVVGHGHGPVHHFHALW